MSEKPAVSRIGGKLTLSPADEQHFAALAEKNGEDPVKVLAEIRRGLPLARLFLKLAGRQVPEVRNGRAPDRNRLATIFRVVDELLWSGCTRSEAFSRAPKILAGLGVVNPDGGPIAVSNVRKQFGNRARIWWEPPPQDEIEQ